MGYSETRNKSILYLLKMMDFYLIPDKMVNPVTEMLWISWWFFESFEFSKSFIPFQDSESSSILSFTSSLVLQHMAVYYFW